MWNRAQYQSDVLICQCDPYVDQIRSEAVHSERDSMIQLAAWTAANSKIESLGRV